MTKRYTEKNIYHSMVVERSKRKSLQMSANLIAGEKQYDSSIINISSRGVGLYINTKFSESTIECNKGSVLKLMFKSPFGEIITLECKVTWLRIQEHPGEGLTTSLGMEVLTPPRPFLRLFNSLI